MPPVEAPEPAFFFSDVHLGLSSPRVERAKEERLLRFLDAVRARGGSLFCLGDLFDFWFEYETAIPGRFFTVLRRLQELSEAGVRLHFLGGNHDFWVRARGPGFLERELGFTLLEDGCEVIAGGLRLLLLHGDGIGPHDRGYRLLKHVLRNRAAIAAFRWVHPDLARRIGRLTSHASRLQSGGAPNPRTCAGLRAYALAVLRERPDLDGVLAGHTHVPEEVELDGRRYVNLGDWIDHATYALAQGGALSLRRFQPAGDGTAPGAPRQRKPGLTPTA